MKYTYKQLWKIIQVALHDRKIYFEISGLAFVGDIYLSVRLIRTDPDDVERAVKAVIQELNIPVDLLVREKTSGTISFVIREFKGVEPEGVPFSSEDEFKGAEPIEIAVELVRQKAYELNKDSVDRPEVLKENFTVYPVWFSYVLGNWKALVSTSIPDGRYYEVTDNKEKGETYVDVYAKTSNTVLKRNN